MYNSINATFTSFPLNVELECIRGTVFIRNVLPDCSAGNKLRVNDILVRINGIQVRGKEFEDVLQVRS